MLDIQLGRRNLSPIQRIAIAEKYRSLYEKQARENLRQASGGDRRSEKFDQNQGLPNLVKVENRIDTTKKLAQVAGVGKETYRQAKRVLDSDNEDIKQRVLSGETSKESSTPIGVNLSTSKSEFDRKATWTDSQTAEEIDAMDWMLTHQLSSKNLSVGEKLAMTEEFKREVALENEKKKSEAISESNRNHNSNTLQLECNENESKSRSNTWTDSQTAKKAGVGVGNLSYGNTKPNNVK